MKGFHDLLRQKPWHPDKKNIVVNLSEVPLEEAAYSALSKGLSFAVAPVSVPIKDILCGVEKAIGACLKRLQKRSDRTLSGSSEAPVNQRTM
jgi:hypothetical protein